MCSATRVYWQQNGVAGLNMESLRWCWVSCNQKRVHMVKTTVQSVKAMGLRGLWGPGPAKRNGRMSVRSINFFLFPTQKLGHWNKNLLEPQLRRFGNRLWQRLRSNHYQTYITWVVSPPSFIIQPWFFSNTSPKVQIKEANA